MTSLVVGIGGGSGCGKTFLARAIRDELGQEAVSLLSMDQYFRSIPADQNPLDVNFDHPGHLDLHLMLRHLKDLKAGKAVRVPRYDFKTMVQTSEAVELQPAPVVLIEGLFVLANPIRPLLDLACFLDVEADQRLVGRLLRDTHERQAAVEFIVERYQRFVRPSYHTFIEPTRGNADIIVDFTYRRSFFTRLLIHVIKHSVEGGFDMREFLTTVEDESFKPGLRPDEGAMPLVPDIFELAKAFPDTPDIGRVAESLPAAKL